MQTTNNDNFILTEISSSRRLAELQANISQREVYQQIGLGLLKANQINQDLIGLGKRLVALAQHAQAARRKEGLEQVSQALMNLPLPGQFKMVGKYYHSFKLKQEGKIDRARTLLEDLVDEVPDYYRGRVIMSLAALLFDSGDFKASTPLYVEANRAASAGDRQDFFTMIQTQRQVAILKSLSGDHTGAVAHLEGMRAITRHVGTIYPAVWFDYLNSLAVELGEAGRIEEAKNICKVVIASPSVTAYPEWQETNAEIETKAYKSQSFVGFTQRKITHNSPTAENVLRLPAQEFLPRPANPSAGRAKILNYTDWKKRAVREPGPDDKTCQVAGEASDRQMLLKIVELASTDDLPDEALSKMVEALERIVKTHKPE